MVDAEPRMDRLVLGTDRGVIVAQFGLVALAAQHVDPAIARDRGEPGQERSEEHTSELQSLMRISYAVFCLKKKKYITEQCEGNRIAKKDKNRKKTNTQK